MGVASVPGAFGTLCHLSLWRIIVENAQPHAGLRASVEGDAACQGKRLRGVRHVWHCTFANPSHPMYGLYKFKKGFGGEIYHQLGCWDYPIIDDKYNYFVACEMNGQGYYSL